MILPFPRPAITRATVAFWITDAIASVIGERVTEAVYLATHPSLDDVSLFQIGLEIESQLLVSVLDFTDHLPVTTVGMLIDFTHHEIMQGMRQ